MADGTVSKGADRQKKYEARRKEQGYSRLCFWVHRDDVEIVKEQVALFMRKEQDDA